jgi:hypothetical protein
MCDSAQIDAASYVQLTIELESGHPSNFSDSARARMALTDPAETNQPLLGVCMS